ncbi:NAD kinase [Bacillus sp. DTU_2020_1000418_1_SI_GHA_SEK_038]|uniref:NAD kinase n=1 Tax=Bacillus sp. DTU_2020_1000418_1_SI_GHA_SEK_038 TaxID=3077585 RepID=UPI0028E9A37D|nr:NAD kinase [Bacillus sp. DTU_2020_1000418_1_SI_GHA_SEK_038]WNS74600.1 NAD kinase [Bacillus sp. DTU_2020_1000418_1_SI_GHA_SEK_038]
MTTRRNVFFYYNNNSEMRERVEPLYELAQAHHFNVVTDYKKANLIASIGGDGAFLQAVRKTGFRDDCLYVGISTLDSPSLYCDFHIDYSDQMSEAMTNEKIEVRRYPTIEVSVDDQTSFYCLNEFSIRSAIIKTFVLDVFIDDFHFETFRGDGMVVATPTGSTAYNKSLRGSIVDPLLPCLQVSEMASLNNNRYRTLGSSFILSGDRKLTFGVVQDGNDHPTMAMDNEALSIQHVEKVDIKLSGKIIKTVKLKDNSFWEKVQRTFL